MGELRGCPEDKPNCYYTESYIIDLRACEWKCGQEFNGAPMAKRKCSCACDYLGTPEECGTKTAGAFSFKANAIVTMISFFMYKYLVN